jgi:hypothetical protein
MHQRRCDDLITAGPGSTQWLVGRTIQLACEAGGESASPRRWRSRAWGTEPSHVPSPRSGRQMKPAKKLRLLSVASFAGSGKLVAVTPGSASPSPGASTLSARFAGSLNGFHLATIDQSSSSLCHLCVLRVSVMSFLRPTLTTETRRTQRKHRDFQTRSVLG